MTPHLAQVPQPIAIFDQFIAKETQTIILREKVLSFSGDSFEIKLLGGDPILRVHGKWLTISGRKKVTDANGKHLFDIVKEHLHLFTTYAAEDPHGKKILEVKSDLTLFGSKATATFTSSTGKAEVLKIKGDWFDHNADIVEENTGATVVRIDRKLLSGRDLIFDKQTYAVVVAPGVDLALAAALCICFDEKNNDEHGGGN